LWDFIHRYWHLGVDELRTLDFDLEECFTLLELQLELQLRDAAHAADAERMMQLKWLLIELLTEALTNARYLGFESAQHRELGRRIYEEKADVLTFNYDALLESAIAASSPMRPGAMARPDMSKPDDPSHDFLDLRRSWNPLLAYKIRFDELVVRAGPPEPVAGDRYYGRFGAPEREDHPAFLKLHGSLDWYYPSGYSISGARITPEGQEPRYRFFRALRFPVLDGERLEHLFPAIITPILHKPLDEIGLFRDIWQRALDILKRTKTLIVGGYSFPATDFHVRRLLREAFAEHELERLCVVNPDGRVVDIARDLCNFRKPVLVYRDIAEFLEHDRLEIPVRATGPVS
jgi:hypothetical protein